MKILVISQKKIMPVNDGAKVYSLGLLKYLKDCGADVTYLSFYEDEDYSARERQELMQYVSDLRSCKLRFQNTGLNVSLRYPNSIRKYTRRAMMELVKKTAAETSFDRVIIDHTQMFEYARLFPNTPVVLYTHNVESDIWRDYAARSTGAVEVMVGRSARMYAPYEAKALGKADVVTAISESDGRRFMELCPTVKPVIFNGYNKFPILKPEENVRELHNKILFIGSYGWHPNALAAEYLMEQVMPLLRKAVPGVKLYLVGKDPTKKMVETAKQCEDIVVTGLVDSVDPYIVDADVFVNAVEDGSGINIKVIEAMGKGIPIVSSVFGVRGMAVEDGREVLLYHSPEQCVENIAKLLQDREAALNLRNCARKFYESFISPSAEVRKALLGE